ncbi:MAG TPA: hypothetical protein DCF42_08645 [Lachnospiraceae bacterium]|nr:hypothetical protein [Lachnospiraceae bacterium]
MPGAILIFIIVVLWGISSYLKNSRSGSQQPKQPSGSGKKKEPIPPKASGAASGTSGSAILERARKNTRDVHLSHQNTGGKRKGSGRGSLTAGGTGGTGSGRRESVGKSTGNGSRSMSDRTEFGHGPLTEAADGASALSSAEQRENRLREELYRERTDANSRNGQNPIMEAARENSLETRLDNLEDAKQDLMKEVERLMILGPDTTLEFARDFTAEGIELMHRLY